MDAREGSLMGKALGWLLKGIAAIIVLLLVVVGSYVAYLELGYSRIEDGQAVAIDGDVSSVSQLVETGRTYTAATYNIGFGAYSNDYTFFMDTGTMVYGTPTQGTSGKAESRESVLDLTGGAITALRKLEADFMILQEVDVDSDRSYHVDQCTMVEEAFPDHEAAFTLNFHSGFLAYPFNDMHGRVNGGLLTLSNVAMSSVTRRSYPIDESFPNKFFDLDRCFTVARLPTDSGRELVLINSHMSAYDEGGVFRAQQLELICGIMAEEYAAGNYVIVGGDWNHALGGSEVFYPTQQMIPEWVAPINDSMLPEGFSTVIAENIHEVSTCRGADMPYRPGISYVTTIDGFIVSDNVQATATNIDTAYAYSDHNPVLLSFELLP